MSCQFVTCENKKDFFDNHDASASALHVTNCFGFLLAVDKCCNKGQRRPSSKISTLNSSLMSFAVVILYYVVQNPQTRPAKGGTLLIFHSLTYVYTYVVASFSQVLLIYQIITKNSTKPSQLKSFFKLGRNKVGYFLTLNTL